MVLKGIRKLASQALMAGALGLAALGSAQATIVVGVWDPAYGAPFDPPGPSALGWRGKVVADVPSSCLALGGPSDNPTVGVCAGTTILSATVEFYDTSAVFPEPTIETLDFTLAFAAVTDVGLQLGDGSPVALRTGASSPVTASVTSLAQFLGVFADFSLDLDYTLAAPSVKLAWSIDPLVCASNALPASACSGVNEGEVKITYSIPEPTAVALACLALLALATTRRNRRR